MWLIQVSPFGVARRRAHPLPWSVVVRRELVGKTNLNSGLYGAIRNLVVSQVVVIETSKKLNLVRRYSQLKKT